MAFFEENHEEFVEWALTFSELIRERTRVDITLYKKTAECVWAPVFVTYCQLTPDRANPFSDLGQEAKEEKSSSEEESSEESEESEEESEEDDSEEEFVWECCGVEHGENEICTGCSTWKCKCPRRGYRNVLRDPKCAKCGATCPQHLTK